ncbi:uncharacterized protein LOC135400808 [Ornithodoros turicata]|uniref:uncharacterized protein LOC135400808 n=1 Tax=Ornithodoros turicata TaxID=34597 RepID=UPI00313A4B7E
MAVPNSSVCSVKWCRNSRSSNRHKFYPMPADDRYASWIEYSQQWELRYLPKKEVISKCFICSAHFTDEDFQDKERITLKLTAVPSMRVNSTKAIVRSGLAAAGAPKTRNVESTCQNLKPPTPSTSIRIAHLQESDSVGPPATPLQSLPGNKAPGTSLRGRLHAEHGTGKDYCAAKWCRNSSVTSGLSFFRFPKDDRRFKWFHYANRPDLEDLPLDRLHERRLCGTHFTSSAFTSKQKTWLKKTACPSAVVSDPRLKLLVPEEFFRPKEGTVIRTTESTASSSQTSPRSTPMEVPASAMPSLQGGDVHDKSQQGNADTNPASSQEPPPKKPAKQTTTSRSYVPIAMKKPTETFPHTIFLNAHGPLPITIITPQPESESSQSLMPLTSMTHIPFAPGIVYYRPYETEEALNTAINVDEDTGPIDSQEGSMDIEDTQFYCPDSPGSLYSSVVETSATTVALQTEESNMETSSFSVLFCCCNSEGANTQVSHKPRATKLTKWTISYIKYS